MVFTVICWLALVVLFLFFCFFFFPLLKNKDTPLELQTFKCPNLILVQKDKETLGSNVHLVLWKKNKKIIKKKQLLSVSLGYSCPRETSCRNEAFNVSHLCCVGLKEESPV